MLATNWATQSHSHVLVFTDCGIGLGDTSFKRTVAIDVTEQDCMYSRIINKCKLSFICIGRTCDSYFIQATQYYKEFLNVHGLRGNIFFPMSKNTLNENSNDLQENSKIQIVDLVTRMCETNYRQFEALVVCGGYSRLKSSVLVWPSPKPITVLDSLGEKVTATISSRFEICGFLSLTDICSPASVSRHLIIPKMDYEKISKDDIPFNLFKCDEVELCEFGKLENCMKSFYCKNDGINSDDENCKNTAYSECNRESICVLLHGALKVENMAALVLLSDSWYGFIHSYADGRKKSNLILNILPPGNGVISWIGDFNYLGSFEDALPGENTNFPIKPEKRSYSQNSVIWIKDNGIQTDIQKLLRHAKKFPEKTLHFYKELNRIRRAALSLGFFELMEGLAHIFKREIAVLPQNASPDCAIQLRHAAEELRTIANRDIKSLITAQPTNLEINGSNTTASYKSLQKVAFGKPCLSSKSACILQLF